MEKIDLLRVELRDLLAADEDKMDLQRIDEILTEIDLLQPSPDWGDDREALARFLCGILPPDAHESRNEIRESRLKKHGEVGGVDDLVRQVSGSMALSGFELTEEDKARLRRAATHPEEIEEILAQLIEKHRRD